MEYAEIISLARKSALERGLPWEEPCAVTKRRPYLLFGPLYWEVVAPSNRLGAAVRVKINDADGTLVEIIRLPR